MPSVDERREVGVESRQSRGVVDGQSRPGWRVAVVSPFALHRDSLALTLSGTPVFTAVDKLAERPAGRGSYDVLVVDFPAVDVDTVRDLVTEQPTVVWGGYLHAMAVADLVAHGLRGYVSVIGSGEDLTHAVARVASGGVWLPEMEGQAVRLTPAEQRVCHAYLVEFADQPRAHVAAELGISERTLKVHLANVRAKVGSSTANRVELARHLRARGILVR